MTADFDSILSRIVDILKANEALSKRVDVFRYGELSKIGNRLTPTECHVYTPTSAMTTAESYGRRTDSDVQFTAFVDVKINGFAVDPESAKRDMVEKATLVRDTLKANPTLRKPGTGIDPLVARSLIRGMDELPELRGRLTPTMIIHLKVQVGSEMTITIPNIGDLIPVLFAPAGSDDVGYAPHLSFYGELKGYAATTESRVRYYDIENTRDIKAKIDAVRRRKRLISFTVNETDEEIKLKGYISGVRPGQAYDGTPIISLAFAVV